MEMLRGSGEVVRAGAYYVRIQAMARAHGIDLATEIDEHDGPDARYVVATDGVLPVATCRIYDLGAGECMLGRVVVLPEARGRGLGRAVIEEAEAWERERGTRTMVLEARQGKEGFYAHLGYVPDGAPLVVGPTFSCIRMHKRLV